VLPRVVSLVLPLAQVLVPALVPDPVPLQALALVPLLVLDRVLPRVVSLLLPLALVQALVPDPVPLQAQAPSTASAYGILLMIGLVLRTKKLLRWTHTVPSTVGTRLKSPA
jgi:hypothetical protein